MTSPKVGRKHYGKVSLSITGKEAWDKQDAAASWSDDGEVRKVVEGAVESLVTDLEGVVAKNAIIGASEYLSIGEMAATLGDNGEILIGVRFSNDKSMLMGYNSLSQFFKSVLTDLRPRLGVDPAAQAMLSQLIALGRNLASLGTAAPQAQPSQPQATH